MIIGIDLGTTNCSLSFVRGGNDAAAVEQFAIMQPYNKDTDQEFFQLPSFFYFPLPEEQREPIVGYYAGKRGEELPDRVIASAKSWACHPVVNKQEAFLPIGDLEEKRSPIDVLSAFLAHLKKTWERKFNDDPFSRQEIYITVPASFDPAARWVVLEAAKKAGYPEITLIEEPLAAFYAWLAKHEHNWRKILKVGDVVLVVDAGGGTTDFSLIAVEEKEGALSLERKAVGDHLLLGGDNMDLALAYFAQSKLGIELDFIRFQSLVHRCREAKEKLLSVEALKEWEIVLQGRGSRLIGSSNRVVLTKEELEKVLVEGFFPEVSLDVEIEQSNLSLAELGLPYVKDPRITAQLAVFLKRTHLLPSKVLFNGGTMKSAAFRDRILSVLRSWSSKEVELLEDADLDFAVSQGAAYYGWAKKNKGIRVRAGTSRNFFIGVEAPGLAVPGMKPSIKAVCIAPLGMEEGSEGVLEQQKFTLRLEESAKFRFFTSSEEGKRIGQRTDLAEVTELKSVEAHLDRQGLEDKFACVQLTSKVTEMGMLELWCVSDTGKKWKLEFDVRKQ